MVATYSDYQRITHNLDASIKRLASDPSVERDTTYYRENISSVRTPADLVSDDRLLRFAMHAFGLGEMSYAKGLIRAVLESDLDDPSSVARSLTDQRFQAFAEAFNFGRYGEFTTGRAATTAAVVDRHVRETLEVRSGETNEGVRLALYFSRRIAEVSTPFQLIADPALFKFVRTAFSLGDFVATMPIDRLADLLENKMDFDKLSDSEYVDSIIQKFSALNDANSYSQAISPVLLTGGGSIHTLGFELMLQISRARVGVV